MATAARPRTAASEEEEASRAIPTLAPHDDDNDDGNDDVCEGDSVSPLAPEDTGRGEGIAAAGGSVADYLRLYSTACADIGCRSNSDLVRTLRTNPHRPLQELRLANNYVGPKGFRAVLRLIDACQTIEVVDLRGNGLDNASVASLCRVTEAHLGVATLLLDHNPISGDAAQCVMRLLSTNRRIVVCSVAHTDILPAVVDRVAQAAAENHTQATGKRPVLAPSKPLALRPGSRVSATSATPTLSTSVLALNPHGMRPSVRVVAKSAIGGPPASGVSDGTAAADGSIPRPPAGAKLTTPKPRPPPPAIASDFHRRLTADHRAELRERYRRRAQQYRTESEKAHATAEADRVRSELRALEAAQARVQEERERRAASSMPASLATRDQKDEDTTKDGPESLSHHNSAEHQNNGESEKEEETTRPPHQDVAPAHQPSQQQSDSGDAGNNRLEGQPTTTASEPSRTRSPTSHRPRFIIGGETTTPAAARHPPQRGHVVTTASMEAPFDATPEDARRAAAALAARKRGGSLPNSSDEQHQQPPAAILVEATDHFRALFNLGCRHYNEGNLDAAYQSWTEALDLATERRNREWMSLLTSNLQALSFEVLMNEAASHIDANALDEAERTLALADRIATRARNAAWMADLTRTRQRVLRGQFQRHHEAAQARFDALQKYQPVTVTDDDRYEEDGVLIQHTGLYVNEWARMLLAKEAMEGWSEAFHRGIAVGGQQGRAMQEVVSTAVQSLCALLVGRYCSFANAMPSELASHHTWGMTGSERSKMLDLWRDIAPKTRVLNNPTWDCLQACQIGNLLFAGNDLTRALEQFTLMEQKAEQLLRDRFLLAVAKLYLGSVHLQRSSFQDAEASLRFASELAADVRRSLPDPAPEGSTGLGEEDDVSPVVAHGDDNHDSGAPTSATGAESPSAMGSASRSDSRAAPHATTSSATPAGGVQPEAGTQASWPTPLAVAALEQRALYMSSRALASAYKFTDALEMHERSLVAGHGDVLAEKLARNFNPATRDHIACVAATMRAPLVFYAVHYRHEWNCDAESFEALEHLYCWIVPSEGDAKFVLVDVKADFGIDSIMHVIDRARRALSVLPDGEDHSVDPVRTPHQAVEGDTPMPARAGREGAIVMEVPELQWRQPLQELYRLLLHRVVDTIAAYAQYTNQNGFVVIPHSFLWLVPFPALVDLDDRFVIEHFTVTHGLSATQLAFSALAWRSASDNGSEKAIVVSQPEGQSASVEPHLAYLTDAHRANAEAQVIAPMLRAEIVTGSSTDVIRIPAVMPRGRRLHVCTPVVSECSRNMMTGGIAATTSYDHLGILHSTDIAFSRILAELAVHTNANVSREAVITGHREGALGWMRALLGCGVACCVFPLWCTFDMIPADVATVFYEELRRTGGHKARAMANAMRRLLAKLSSPVSNPRIWASFVVLGFPMPLLSKRKVPRKPPGSRTGDAAATVDEDEDDDVDHHVDEPRNPHGEHFEDTLSGVHV